MTYQRFTHGEAGNIRVRLYFVEYLRYLLQDSDCGFLVAVDSVFSTGTSKGVLPY